MDIQNMISARSKDSGATPAPAIIKVGSRKSKLAMIQTEIVIEALKAHCSSHTKKEVANPEYQIVTMSTIGDEILGKALPAIGAKSLFTGELESALLRKEVDFLVHSLKDLPTTLPSGCSIGCILERDDKNDVIVVKKSLRDKIDPRDLLNSESADQSGQCKVLGTSSQRRIAMLKRCNQNLNCIDIRGNLNTRLRKLDDEKNGTFTAIILAAAGLKRLRMSDRISMKLTPSVTKDLIDFEWCYAVGQGAIAVECRSDDEFIKELLSPIVDLQTLYETIAERSLMKRLEGGCSVPLGVRTSWPEGTNVLKLKGMVLSVDGKELVEEEETIDLSTTTERHCELEDVDLTDVDVSRKILTANVERMLIHSALLGQELASKLTASGAKKLLDEIKRKRIT